MSTPEHGPDLPIYPPETPVAWSNTDIVRAARSREATFIRRTQLALFGISCGSLREALDIADDTIDMTAAALDARAIPHTWGLYHGEAPPDLAPYLEHPLIPKGYQLVAEVPVIRPARRLPRQDPSFRAMVFSLQESPARLDRYLIDLHPWQVIEQRTGRGIMRWLVDIEPKLQKS